MALARDIERRELLSRLREDAARSLIGLNTSIAVELARNMKGLSDIVASRFGIPNVDEQLFRSMTLLSSSLTPQFDYTRLIGALQPM